MESKRIKKGKFIELNYTGKLTEEGLVFDTTIKKVAEEHDLKTQSDYKPVIICVGEGFILPALEAGLIDKTIGKHFFNLRPEDAFGKKSAKLLKLVPQKVFKEQDIYPRVGLEVNIDGAYGVIRSATGGRVIVDFNHPLSGRDVSYEVEVKKFVTDEKEQVESLIKVIGFDYDSVGVKEERAVVVLNRDIPVELKKLFEDKVKELTKVKEFSYVVKKAK